MAYANAGATEGSTASSGSVLNNSIASGYNGDKIIQTIPNSTSFTVRYFDQVEATTSTAAGTAPTVTNTTNVSFNGTKTLTSATGSQFTYNL